METKVAIVTGASSGIGKCVAEELVSCGIKVYDFSRRKTAHVPGIEYIATDVTDPKNIDESFNAVLVKEGKTDILINCAGFGISGAIEFTSLEEAKSQFEVNFFGMTNMCRAILPQMRKRGEGRIVNISSVAAPCAIPFQAYYSASKSAINTYTAALANEVKPYGITVTVVQPGDICTGFTEARKKSCAGDEEYGGRVHRSVAKMEDDEKNGMNPGAAAKYIVKIALKRKVKPIYTIGFTYKAICVLCKLLPCGFLNYLIYRLYAE